MDKYLKYKSKYFNLKRTNNKTYVEFITKSDEPIRVSVSDIETIDNLIKQHLHHLTDSLLCLDFHGITDLYGDNEMIPSRLPKCIISYIGGSPKTIKSTIETIKPRVMSNEVIMGIIVYNKNNLPTCGTKGWIINKMLEHNDKLSIYFIDDSEKNVQCVNNVGSNKIKTFYVDKNKNPRKYLDKILLSLN